MINAANEYEIAESFQVQAVPTLIIIKEGTIIYDESGCIPEYALKNIVEKARNIDPNKLDN